MVDRLLEDKSVICLYRSVAQRPGVVVNGTIPLSSEVLSSLVD